GLAVAAKRQQLHADFSRVRTRLRHGVAGDPPARTACRARVVARAECEVGRVSRRANVGVVAALLAIAAQLTAQRGGVNPMDSIRRLPGYRAAHDSTVFLSSSRIAARVPALAREWNAYVARSRAVYDKDTASMARELRAARRTAMTRAPYVHDFSVKPFMTKAWFSTDSAH